MVLKWQKKYQSQILVVQLQILPIGFIIFRKLILLYPVYYILYSGSPEYADFFNQRTEEKNDKKVMVSVFYQIVH